MPFFDNPFESLKEQMKAEKPAKPAKPTFKPAPKPNPNRDEFREIFSEPSADELAAIEAEAAEFAEHLRQKESRLQNEFLEFVEANKIKKI